VFIEAVTVNPTQAKEAAAAEAAAGGLAGWDLFTHRMQNVYPIKFGSPLFSKMQKKYWEQDHVRGQPFILAIEDFQEPGSMVWTGSALEVYLYGYEYGWYREVTGELVVVPEAVAMRKGAKEIPSFFASPDAEHVSAVLFSNSATIAKFNRMGFLKGYRPEQLGMIRAGSCFNHQPHATEPCPFMYTVGDPSAPEETWAQGLSMFHNPKALVPVPEELFPGIAHHRLDKLNRMRSVVPPFHPYGSVTQVLNWAPDPMAGPPGGPPVSSALLQMLRGEPPTGAHEAKAARPGVRRISREEYRSHNLAGGPILAPAMEKAWFADEKGLLGTVFLDVTDKDWNFAVLGPDEEGVYRWLAGNGGMETQEEAEQELIAEMASIDG
jgi:hypothetical protein